MSSIRLLGLSGNVPGRRRHPFSSAASSTGGSSLHGLVTEHQLRPLLSFFHAFARPTRLDADEADFTDDRLTGPAVAARIERAAREAAELLASRVSRETSRLPRAAHA